MQRYVQFSSLVFLVDATKEIEMTCHCDRLLVTTSFLLSRLLCQDTALGHPLILVLFYM